MAARSCTRRAAIVLPTEQDRRRSISSAPGRAPDLITVRGLRLVRSCPVVLYAGSLVPGRDRPGRRGHARRPHHRHRPLELEAIVGAIAAAHREGLEVARVHSGDPSFYGAIGEQMRRLRRSAFPTTSPRRAGVRRRRGALQQELTLPGVAQSVVLTRTAVRASPCPLARPWRLRGDRRHARDSPVDQQSGAGGARADARCGADCPIVVVYRVSWPDQRVICWHPGHDPGACAARRSPAPR